MPWVKITIGASIVAIIAPFIAFGTAMGLLSAAACAAWDEIPFAECEFILESGNGYDSCGDVSPELVDGVPEEWASIISEAAKEHQVNPNFLAATFLTENGNTWKPLDSDWASSSAGASGPMQFMPGTWDDYGIDGDGDGDTDIMDPVDALHSAASLYSASPKKGAPAYGSTTPNMPAGDISKPWVPGRLLYASATYNAGPGTISKYTTPSDGLDDPEWTRAWEVRRYLHNIDGLLSSDLTKSGVTAENGYTQKAGGRKDHNGNYIAPWSDPHGMGVGGGEGGDGDSGGGACTVPTGDLGAVVQIAKEEFEKHPVESPCTRVCDVYIGGSLEAWCADFVSWVFKTAGIPFKSTPSTDRFFWRHDWQMPAVDGMEAWFKEGAHGSEFFTPSQKDPRPGDVAIYSGHVNIVVAVDPGNETLVTIGGNESDTIQRSTGTFAAGTSSGLVGYGRVNAEAADEEDGNG